MVPMVNESNAMAEELGKQVTTRTIFEIVFVGLLSDKERTMMRNFLAGRQLKRRNKITILPASDAM